MRSTFEADPHLEIRDLHPPRGDVKAEVLAGLGADPPQLPCKLFYDEAGSRLFEEITRQPEYYQTRTESRILQDCASELAELVGKGVTLVEYGSGSSTKTQQLLERLNVAAYVPIDISRWYLETSAQRLSERYPDLPICPVIADYQQAIQLDEAEATDSNCVGFFPGSTIGNFDPDEAVAFLERLACTLGPRGHLVIGVDLRKDPRRLHAAYNDAAGVTAAFNLNILSRLNHELGADFDLDAWVHYAPYNPLLGRVEMHLIALRDQSVSLAGTAFDFDRGTGIHTENSYKYTRRSFAKLAARAGFDVQQVWTDDEGLFSVQLLRVRP